MSQVVKNIVRGVKIIVTGVKIIVRGVKIIVRGVKIIVTGVKIIAAQHYHHMESKRLFLYLFTHRESSPH